MDDVLLEVQRDNLAGFPLSRLSIKALLLVAVISPSLFLISTSLIDRD